MATKDDDDFNLDSLSPEERAALDEEATEYAEAAEIAKATADEEDAAGEAAEKTSREAEEAAKAKVGDEDDEEEEEDGDEPPAKADEPVADDVGEDEKIAALLAEKAPKLVAAPDAARLEAIKAERAELRGKFNDGDLTEAEFDEKLEALVDEQAELKAQKARADESLTAYQEWDQRQWAAACVKFAREHTAFSMEAGATDEQKARTAALNAIVVSQAKAAAAENRAISYLDLLDESYAIYKHRNPDFVEDSPKAKAATKPAKAETKPAPKGKRPEIPPRLASIPAADVPDGDENPWTQLDKLAESDPQRYEELLARMPEDRRIAYERAS